MVISSIEDALGIVPKGLEKKTGETENQRGNQDHPNHTIVKVC